MKCSKCGKEFGDSFNCKNCGVDRITGLANYRSYHNPEVDKKYSSYDGDSSSSSPKTMICFACGEIIPENSEYCPYCSTQLYVTCPKCGNTYSSQFPACNKCGTNREHYYKYQETERQRAIIEEEERQRKQKEWEKSEEESCDNEEWLIGCPLTIIVLTIWVWLLFGQDDLNIKILVIIIAGLYVLGMLIYKIKHK